MRLAPRLMAVSGANVDVVRRSEFEICADDYADVPPSTVVLLGKVRAKRGNGSGYAVEIGIVNRLENGKIVSFHSYQSKRRAMEEARGG